MFENIMKFFKKISKKEEKKSANSKDAAKERLHLVLMQDRANVSADFLELMKQEIIDVIKKYIDVDESAIDVRLTNKENEDGTNGAPALYANIPIVNIKNETKEKSNSVKEDINIKENKKETKNKEEKDITSEEDKEEQVIEDKEIKDENEDNEQEAQETKEKIKTKKEKE